MMQPVVRNAAIWAFSALFGCISLFGSGWHALVGHAHHPHVAHDFSQAAHLHHEPGSHDCHKHAGDHDPNTAGNSQLVATTAVGADHDCVICSFFSQAQWATSFEVPLFAFAVCEISPSAEQSPWVGALGVYQSRAPPADPATC